MSEELGNLFSDAAASESEVTASEGVEEVQNDGAQAPVADDVEGAAEGEVTADGEADSESETTGEAVADGEAEDGEEVVTEETVRKRIRGLPGDWYVLHTYAGYEKRIKQDIESRMHSMNMEDYIFEVQVPMEQAYEVDKKGKRKLVTRVRMPGYALVRMEMTDESWRVVQDTNGVTGFVGNGRDPVALTEREVVQMLTPVVEQEAAAAAKAAGKPITTGAPELVADYEVGETVTLTAEPWVGMPATISEVDVVNQRLTVLMTLVGQETPVDLAFDQVKKMD